MEDEEPKKSQFEKSIRSFGESILKTISDNFITILTIMFLIAVITGIRNGCHAIHTNNP